MSRKLNVVVPNNSPIIDANGINKNNKTLSLRESQLLLIQRDIEIRISITNIRVAPLVQSNVKYKMIKIKSKIITI